MPDFSGRFVSTRNGLVYEYLVHYDRSSPAEFVWDATFMHLGSVACKPAGVLAVAAEVPEEIPRHLVDLAARRAIEDILAT